MKVVKIPKSCQPNCDVALCSMLSGPGSKSGWGNCVIVVLPWLGKSDGKLDIRGSFCLRLFIV